MKDGSMELNKNETVKILWTGGWDSTFRVLQLLLLEKRKVQPYYIIDTGRKSTDAEFKAMDHIKDQLFLKYPAAKKLLLPTIIGNISEIEPNQKITDAYQSILKWAHLGSQYDFLARYSEQEHLCHLEIAMQKGSTINPLDSMMQSYFIQLGDDHHPNYELDDKAKGTDFYTLFRYFRFPVLFITKLEMQEIAIKNGFMDLMELTWFCHKPQKYGNHYEPCGVCYPCGEVMATGMGKRMPLRSKIRYYFRVHSRVEKLSRKYPMLSDFARKWKRRFLK